MAAGKQSVTPRQESLKAPPNANESSPSHQSGTNSSPATLQKLNSYAKKGGSSQQQSSHGSTSTNQSANRERQETKQSIAAALVGVPSFLIKTYDIVNDPELDHIICWSEAGDCFIVKQPNEFAERILPRFFKHNNFSSFVRQLNMYDFHKTRNNSNEQCFCHVSFKKGFKHLLAEIKRKMSLNQQMQQQQQATGTGAQHVFKHQPLTHSLPNGSHQFETYHPFNSNLTVVHGNHSDVEPNGGTFENMTAFQDDSGDSILRQTIAQLEALNAKHSELETKIVALQQKNQEQANANQNLWNELCKSREREVNLEKLLSVFFSCTMNNSGNSGSGTYSLSQLVSGISNLFMIMKEDQPNSTSKSNLNDAEKLIAYLNQGRDQVAIRNQPVNQNIFGTSTNTNDQSDSAQQQLIFNVLKKIVSQPSLLNNIIGVLSQGLRNGGFTQEFAQVLQGTVGQGMASQLFEILAKQINSCNASGGDSLLINPGQPQQIKFAQEGAIQKYTQIFDYDQQRKSQTKTVHPPEENPIKISPHTPLNVETENTYAQERRSLMRRYSDNSINFSTAQKQSTIPSAIPLEGPLEDDNASFLYDKSSKVPKLFPDFGDNQDLLLRSPNQRDFETISITSNHQNGHFNLGASLSQEPLDLLCPPSPLPKLFPQVGDKRKISSMLEEDLIPAPNFLQGGDDIMLDELIGANLPDQESLLEMSGHKKRLRMI